MSYAKSHIISNFKNWISWFTVLVISAAFQTISVAQSVTAATGGTGLNADFANPITYTTLTGPLITESAAGQISLGTIVLNAPSGWQFNTAQTVTATVTLAPGLNGQTKLQLSSATATPTSSTITFTVSQTSDNGGNRAGRITFSNIQIAPTSGVLSGTKMITNSGTAVPSGISYGNLSLVVGNPAEISVETMDDGSGVVVPVQDLDAGTDLEVYAISRDQFGNLIGPIEADSWEVTGTVDNVETANLSSEFNSFSTILNSTLVGEGEIQANESGLNSVPSGTITVIPGVANNLAFDTSPSASVTAGVVLAQQPVVKMVDIYGNTVTSFSGNELVASRGTGTGTLQGDVDVNFSAGIATFTNLSHQVADDITINFNVSGYSQLGSATITVDPASASALSFTVSPPNGEKNVPLTPNPSVQIVDAFGNNVSQSGTQINLAINSGPNGGNITYTPVNTDVGLATFTDVELSKNGSYTLTASDNGATLTPVTSGSFTIVSSGTLANFVIDTVGYSLGTGTIGTHIAGDSLFLKISAVDGGGALLESFSGRAFISSTGNNGFGLNDSTESFFGGEVLDTLVLRATGNFSINATRNSISTSGNSFDVIPAEPSTVFSTISAAPISIVADGASTTLLEIQIVDTLGNLYTSSAGASYPVLFNIESGNGSLVSSITDNNDGTYEQQLMSPTTAGTATIGFTIDGNPADSSIVITYSPGGLSKFGVELDVVSNKTAGTSFDINIYAQDANDNTVTSFNGSVDITSNKTGSSGLGTFSLSNGELLGHSITLTESGAGDATITATNSVSSQTGTTTAFTIVPASLDVPTSTVTSANRFIDYTSGSTTITVQLKDQYGNNLLDNTEVSSISLDISNPVSPSSTWNGSLTNNVDGTYTRIIDANGVAEILTINATINTITTDDLTLYVAEVNEWTSSGGGGSNPLDWSRAGNWTLGVPTSSQAILIPSIPTNAVKFPLTDAGSPITVAFIEIESSATLNVESGFTFNVTEDITGAGTMIVDNATVNVGGNVSVDNLNAAGSTVNFNGTTAQTISGSVVSGNLNITNTSQPVTVSSSGYINASTALNIGPGAILNMNSGTTMELYGSLTGSGTLNTSASDIIIAGDISLTNADFSTSDVTLNGTGIQTLSEDLTYGTLSITNTSATVTFQDNTTVNGTLNLTSGSTIQVDGTLTANTLVASGTTIGIGGNLNITNITSEPTTVEFNGTTDQEVSFLDSFNNLTVNKSSGALIADDDLIVDGTLTMTSGDLIMGSGTNLLADTRSITSGNIRFQRIFSEAGWYAISSPVDTETFGDFLGGILTQGYTGADVGVGASNQPSVVWYDETYNPDLSGTPEEGPISDVRRWRAPTDASTAITPGLGYFVYIFPNVPTDSRYQNISLPDTIDVGDVGTENTFTSSEFDLNVTYTEATDQDPSFNGWNLVGNPFGATIDWDDTSNWDTTKIDASIYVWDHTANSGYGDYLVWNGVYGSLGNGLIAPFQAFWVRANGTLPSLIIKDGIKTSGGVFYNVEEDVESEPVKAKSEPPPVISLSVSTDSLEKETFIMFSENGSMGKDRYDAYLLEPFTDTFLEIYTRMDDGTPLVINNLYRKFGIDLEIPVYIDGYMHGKTLSDEITIKLDSITNIPDSWELTLIDQVTKQKTILNNKTEYSFKLANSKERTKTVSGLSGQTKRKGVSERFSLKISPGDDARGLPDEFGLSQNYPNPFNPSTKIDVQIPIQSNAQLKVYDILGREVATLIDTELTAGFHTFEWNTRGLSTGVYISRLVTSDGVFTKKMTLIK